MDLPSKGDIYRRKRDGVEVIVLAVFQMTWNYNQPWIIEWAHVKRPTRYVNGTYLHRFENAYELVRKAEDG